jgi:hypothetical protein
MAKQTASYSIVSKNDSVILLQLRHEAKTGATSLLDDEVVLTLVSVSKLLHRLALDLSSLSCGAPG